MAKSADHTTPPDPRLARDRDRIVTGEAALAVIRSKRRLLIQRRLVEIAVVAQRAQSLALEDAPLVDALKRLDTLRRQARVGDHDATTRLAELRDAGRGRCRRGAGHTLTALTRRQVRAELRLAGIRRRLLDRTASLDAGRKAALGVLVARAGRRGLAPNQLKTLAADIARTLNAGTPETIQRLEDVGLNHRRLLLATRQLLVRLPPRDLIALGAPLLAQGLDAWPTDVVLGALIEIGRTP